MAWKAKLITPISHQGDKVVAVFEYYDDQVLDPVTSEPVMQGREGFTFPPNWSTTDMQASVVARGTAFKAAKARADVLAAQFPPNTTIINIP